MLANTQSSTTITDTHGCLFPPWDTPSPPLPSSPPSCTAAGFCSLFLSPLLACCTAKQSRAGPYQTCHPQEWQEVRTGGGRDDGFSVEMRAECRFVSPCASITVSFVRLLHNRSCLCGQCAPSRSQFNTTLTVNRAVGKCGVQTPHNAASREFQSTHET